MTQILEIFFGLAVGLPLAIIGLIGLVAILASSVASGVTLFPRGRVGQAVGILFAVLLVVLMAIDVIPAARMAGVPVLLVAAVMTFTTHQRLARQPERIAADIPIAVTALAGLVALAVPIFILMFKGIGA
jgi:hypothetical protein